MPPKQSTPASTQQTQASATPRTQTPAPSDNSQRRPGRAKGSQGYSTEDCMALVEAVKEHLPLGSQEWGYVLERYNTYANDNKRAIREQDSIKYKFQALVKHAKPTGDPNCPSHVREAKLTQKAMDNRAHVVACNDDAESDDDQNGVRAPIPMSAEPTQQNTQSQWSTTSWSTTQSQRVQGEEVELMDEDEQSGDVPAVPANNANNSTQSNPLPNSPVMSTFSSWVPRPNEPAGSQSSTINEFNSAAPQTGPHRRGGSRAASRSSPIKSTNRSGAAGCTSSGSPAGTLEQHLTAWLDPAARQKREMENSMTQFYANQLRDAGKTIENLRDENNRLRFEDQSKANKLKEKLTELKIENSSLKAKLELLQMKIEMASSNNHQFNSQPLPFGHVNYQQNNAQHPFAHVPGATAGEQAPPAGEQVAFDILD
ncbi:hypothetical protein PCASD_16074 [Puccinia coronata f. sp. avenae]|uniref:DUF6818 domain-containing protein n=1 Tax=Puccinia coronata f. sp. avenae TaxID=200324 RepID=A0A2N5SYH7_9BASI|nr:hypothetical protein PCASD_16074 [Puccinia coronata f. sp. avenae]